MYRKEKEKEKEKGRGHFLVSIISMSAIAAATATTATPALLLTSGASGRVNVIFSLRTLKSLVLLIKASIFFLLLLPFQLGLWRTSSIKQPSPTSSSSSSSSNSVDRDEKKHHNQENRITTKKSPSPFFFFFFGGGRKLPVAVPGSLVRTNSINKTAVVVAGDTDAATRRELAIKRVTENNISSSSLRDFSLLVTSRGDTLFTQSWTPRNTNIRGLVVLLHGLNEHSGRYDGFAKKLNENGFKVYGMDWIGHGGSDGLHAYVPSLDYAVDDAKAFIEKIVSENPSLPCFCFAHSTGAAIILKTILDSRMKPLVRGVVLTSPAVGVQPSHPIFGVLAPVASFLLPKYQFSAANKNGTTVSRDPEALIAKYSDPLVYTGSIRVRTGYEILCISAYLQQNLSKLTTPFLVLHGTCDAVTDPGASVEMHRKAPSCDKSIKLYNGLLHDLLFEPEKEIVAKDIIDWLNYRVQAGLCDSSFQSDSRIGNL